MSLHRPDLDVTDVLDDPDFRDDALEVKRQAVEHRCDGLATGMAGWSRFSGTPYPASGRDLIQTPDGDHVAGDLVIVTRFPLSAGDAQYAADLVAFEGHTYRVTNTKPFRYGPGFLVAVCELTQLNPSTMPEDQDRGALV